jgi:hypothetical protein
MASNDPTITLEPAGPQETAPDGSKREALVFLPGISANVTDQSVEGISLHLAAAMDRYAKSGRAKFRVGEVREETHGNQGIARATTIFREDDGKENPIVDVYRLEYGHLFEKKLQDESLLRKIVRIPVTIVPAATSLVKNFRSKALSSREKLQFLIVLLGLVVLMLYAFLVVGAIVETIQDVRTVRGEAASQGVPAEEDRAWYQSLWEFFKETGTFLVVLLAALGLVMPKSDQIRQAIIHTATMILAVISYHQQGERRAVLSGQLLSLLEHIAQKPDIEYSRVNLLAFSFGSLIALDTLFPRGFDTPERVKSIHTLVTIGSPFDFVHMMWPRYFASRTPLPELTWYNIYSPEDVLSSNFRPHSKSVSARTGNVEESSGDKRLSDAQWLAPPTNIKYTLRNTDDELKISDIFFLYGLRNHGQYWEAEKAAQINAFDMAVSRMFKESPVLQ